MTVGETAQPLRCDQPNSLKSQPNFLDINPDSFMCDVLISLRDNIVESVHDLGKISKKKIINTQLFKKMFHFIILVHIDRLYRNLP